MIDNAIEEIGSPSKKWKTKKSSSNMKIVTLQSVSEKTTKASSNNKVNKFYDDRFEKKLNKLEIEMNSRFRLLEDKYINRIHNIEKRLLCIENENKHKIQDNLKLLKNVHTKNKNQMNDLEEANININLSLNNLINDMKFITNTINKYKYKNNRVRERSKSRSIRFFFIKLSKL